MVSGFYQELLEFSMEQRVQVSRPALFQLLQKAIENILQGIYN